MPLGVVNVIEMKGLNHSAYFGVDSFNVTRNFFPSSDFFAFPFSDFFAFTSGLLCVLSVGPVCSGSVSSVVVVKMGGVAQPGVSEAGLFVGWGIGSGPGTGSLGDVETGLSDAEVEVDGDSVVGMELASWIAAGIVTCGVGLSEV